MAFELNYNSPEKVRASVAYPVPEYGARRLGTVTVQPKKTKEIKEKVIKVESQTEEEFLSKKDYIIQAIIGLITFSLFVAKIVGMVYKDPFWVNLEWVWVVSPLWITYLVSITLMFTFKLFGEKM